MMTGKSQIKVATVMTVITNYASQIFLHTNAFAYFYFKIICQPDELVSRVSWFGYMVVT